MIRRTIRRLFAASSTLFVIAACSANENETCPAKQVSCLGVPVACADRPASDCNVGCTPTGTCGGTPPACDSRSTETACDQIEGCFWQSSGTCTGTPVPCPGFQQFACAQQLCAWQGRCEGTPTSGCESLGSGCETVLGCYEVSSGGCNHTPHCQGRATSCHLLVGSQCDASIGCVTSGKCAGTTTSCSTATVQAWCTELGCSWSSTNQLCSGVTPSCSSLSSESFCNVQPGCLWDEECAGDPLDCDALSLETCAEQPGCVWL